MKNNFKKIIVGLLMLSSATGCSGLLNNSTFNTENLSSKISDLLNNSTDHKHSSSSSLSDKITSTSTTTSSNDKTSSTNSSSSSNSSSNSSSSSSNSSSSSSSEIGGDVINSNEVSKDTWESALSIEGLSNVTIEGRLNAEMPVSGMPSYISAGAVMYNEYKIDNNKAKVYQEQSSVMIIDKALLMEDMNLTDEQAEMVVASLAQQSGGVLEKDGNTYKISMGSDSHTEYLEKETDETSYDYNYRKNFKRYYKSRILINFKEEALGNFNEFLLVDSFEDAIYDQNKKAYRIDGSKLSEDAQAAGFTGDLHYYFEGDRLTKMIIEGSTEGTTMTSAYKAVYEFDFINYGTTTVTLPSGNMIQPCDHLTSSNSGQNDAYHYISCGECMSVLEYERHEFGAHDCPECGYVPTYNELITVDGLDEIIKVYKVYNALNNTLYELNFSYTGSGSATWWSINDPETGEIIGEERHIGGAQHYIRALWEDEATSETCVSKRTITYNFLDKNTNEPACAPLVVETKRVVHHYANDITTIEDGCKVTDIKKCLDCSHEEMFTYYRHDYRNVIYSEKDSECHVIGLLGCKDCERVEYYAEYQHNISFTILDADNRLGRITCSDCGLDETGSYTYNSYDLSTHLIEFRSADNDYFWFDEKHNFVDGHCVCGHEEIQEDIK